MDSHFLPSNHFQINRSKTQSKSHARKNSSKPKQSENISNFANYHRPIISNKIIDSTQDYDLETKSLTLFWKPEVHSVQDFDFWYLMGSNLV